MCCVLVGVNGPLRHSCESVVTSARLRWVKTVWRSTQHVESEENLATLPPKGSFMAAQSVERTIVEIGETQKATSDLRVNALERTSGAAKIVPMRVSRRFVISATIVPFRVRLDTSPDTELKD